MIDIPVTLFLSVLVFAVALGALIAAWAAQPIAEENRAEREKPKRGKPYQLPFSIDDEVSPEERINQLDDDWMDEVDYYEQQRK